MWFDEINAPPLAEEWTRAITDGMDSSASSLNHQLTYRRSRYFGLEMTTMMDGQDSKQAFLYRQQAKQMASWDLPWGIFVALFLIWTWLARGNVLL
jgi:hypothetical protein